MCPSDRSWAKIPASHSPLANTQMFNSFKNLGKDPDLTVFVQTLVLKWISGFPFLVLINKTNALGLKELSLHFSSLLLTVCPWENNFTSLNCFFICDKRLDLSVCARYTGGYKRIAGFLCYPKVECKLKWHKAEYSSFWIFALCHLL